MKLSFLGAAHTVTGSCCLLELGDHKLLVDCGMFQGGRRIRELNYAEPLFNPADIDCVLLTHAHIDHCGLIPRLIRHGFGGQVYATKATCDLVRIMLPDSAGIQEADAEQENRRGKRRGEAPIEPLYSLADATEALERLVAIPYGEAFSPIPGVETEFHDAGHILGSAILVLTATESGGATRFVFSGDLGQPNQPIIKDPTTIDGADFLVVESTYGDRRHQFYDKEEALAEVINDTMDRGGNVIIPAFAVGRTQTLLYYLYKLFQARRIEDSVPVILDSPLAIAATRVFMQNTRDFDEDALAMFQAAGSVAQFPQLRICETAAESRELNSHESSAIIISASGMADAGRILHHLKHNLWRPESTVLFVGYQAEGSLGRRLLDGVRRVRVMGEEIVVKAKIQSLDGFSAHADAEQIIEWASGLTKPKPAKVFIVHGESMAQENLKSQFSKQLGLESYIPFRGDAVVINGRASEIHKSSIPAVNIESEVEARLQELESEYRQQRRKIIQLIVRKPELMEPVMRLLSKSRTYRHKLFHPYNI